MTNQTISVLISVIMATGSIFIYLNKRLAHHKESMRRECKEAIQRQSELARLTFAPIEAIHAIELNMNTIRSDISQILSEVRKK